MSGDDCKVLAATFETEPVDIGNETAVTFSGVQVADKVTTGEGARAAGTGIHALEMFCEFSRSHLSLVVKAMGLAE